MNFIKKYSTEPVQTSSLTGPTQPASAQSPSNFPPIELRLVLLGRTGAGKSATGNTILGEKCFESEVSMSSVTKHCKKEIKMIQGRRLAVIDTPGWFDTSLSPADIEDEVLKCLAMCSPGPHAFLLIIPITRFTEEQQQCIDLIKRLFQENFNKHTIIIFTHADLLDDEPIEQFIARQDERIQQLVEQFSNRFLAFNNKDPDNHRQVQQLLEKLNELLAQNRYQHFANQKTELVSRALAVMEEHSVELMNQIINKVKLDVRKEVENRREEIRRTLKEDRQEIQRGKERIRVKIKQIEENLRKENENQRADSHKLQRLQESLCRESRKLTNLDQEEETVEKEAEKERQELDIWAQEEEEKRVTEEREKLKDDGSKWYKDPFYFSMLKYFIIFLGGSGVGFGAAPFLFGLLAPAAHVGLAAELSALLGPEVVAILTAAATKAGPLLGAIGTRAAFLLASQCSVQ